MTDSPYPTPGFPQNAALECNFGQEEIFEALWVNESAVLCNQVMVSGVAPARGGGGLHNPTAFFPSNLLTSLLPHSECLIPPVPKSPALISLHDIPSLRRDPNTICPPHAFSPPAAAHDPEEPGVSTQPPTKGTASSIPGQPGPHDRLEPPSTPHGHRGLSHNGWGSAFVGVSFQCLLCSHRCPPHHSLIHTDSQRPALLFSAWHFVPMYLFVCLKTQRFIFYSIYVLIID